VLIVLSRVYVHAELVDKSFG